VRRHAGFTLIELIVVVAVITGLVAAVTPALVQQILDRRIQATQDEVRVLHDAIVGNPSEMRFGFVGDIGRTPNSLQELVQRGGLPGYSNSTTRGIGIGWRGPYVNAGTSTADALTDSFGRSYTTSAGQVRSAGPDGIPNNSDDIVYPPSAPAITGSVFVTLKTKDVNGVTIVDPPLYEVRLTYARDGAEETLVAAGSPFNFTNVPMGVHALQVVSTGGTTAGTVIAEDTVVVRPRGSAVLEFTF